MGMAVKPTDDVLTAVKLVQELTAGRDGFLRVLRAIESRFAETRTFMSQQDHLIRSFDLLIQLFMLFPFLRKVFVILIWISRPYFNAIDISRRRSPKAHQVKTSRNFYSLAMDIVKPISLPIRLEEIFTVMIARHKENFTIENIFNFPMNIQSSLEHFFFVMVHFIVVAVCGIAAYQTVIEFLFGVVMLVYPLRKLCQTELVQVYVCYESDFQPFGFVQHQDLLLIVQGLQVYPVRICYQLCIQLSQSECNIYLTQMAEDDFQILVTTQDFLKLQARCHDLQLQNRKLEDLNSKIFELTEQNNENVKKMKKMEDNNKYLSLQGIKMAQTILEMTRKAEKPPHEQAQKQVQSQMIPDQKCLKCETFKLQNDKIRDKSVSLQQNYSQKVQQLQNELKKMAQEMAKTDENVKQFKLKYDSVCKQNQCLLREKESNVNNSKQQQAAIGVFKEELEQCRTKLKNETAEKERLAKQLKAKMQEGEALLTPIKAQLEEWKHYGSVKVKKLDQAEEKIKQYIDLVKGLNLEINQKEKGLKEKDELIMFYQNLEKENNVEIRRLQTQIHQIRSKEMREVNPLLQIKTLIEEYFVNTAFKFCDAGGLRADQIEKMLKSQEEAVIKLIRDTVNPIIHNLDQDSRPKMKMPNLIKM